MSKAKSLAQAQRRIAKLERALKDAWAPLQPGPCNCCEFTCTGARVEWMAALGALEKGLGKAWIKRTRKSWKDE